MFEFLKVANVNKETEKKIFRRFKDDHATLYINHLINTNKLKDSLLDRIKVNDFNPIYNELYYVDKKTLHNSLAHDQLYDLLDRFAVYSNKMDKEKSSEDMKELVLCLCSDFRPLKILQLIKDSYYDAQYHHNNWYFDKECTLMLLDKYLELPTVDTGLNPVYYMDSKYKLNTEDEELQKYASKFRFLYIMKDRINVDDVKKDMRDKILKTNDPRLISYYIITFNDLEVPDKVFENMCKESWYIKSSEVKEFISENSENFSKNQKYYLLMYGKCFQPYLGYNTPDSKTDAMVRALEIISKDNNVFNSFICDKLNEIKDAIRNNDYSNINNVEVYISRMIDALDNLSVKYSIGYRRRLIDIVIKLENMSCLDTINPFTCVSQLKSCGECRDDDYVEMHKEERTKIYKWLFGDSNEINYTRLNKYKDEIIEFIVPFYDYEAIKVLTPYFIESNDKYTIRYIDKLYNSECVLDYVLKSNNRDLIALLILLNDKALNNNYFKTVKEAFNYFIKTPFKLLYNDEELKIINAKYYYEDSILKEKTK